MVRESLASDRTRAVSQVGGVHTVGGARFAASAQSSAALMAIRDAPMSCGKLVPSVTRCARRSTACRSCKKCLPAGSLGAGASISR